MTKTSSLETATVYGRTIKYIDTPGVLDTSLSEEELKSEILRLVVKCPPRPHAFLIILKVETYTAHEIEIVREIRRLFGEDALKYAVVLFTHGDNLDENQTIEEFVSKNFELQQLVYDCGGRCHVIDNRYWNKQWRGGYRSNRVQIENLLNTIEDMVKENGGSYYTNDMIQDLEMYNNIKKEELREEFNDRLTEEQISDEAEERTYTHAKSLYSNHGAMDCMQCFLGCFRPCSERRCSEEYVPLHPKPKDN